MSQNRTQKPVCPATASAAKSMATKVIKCSIDKPALKCNACGLTNHRFATCRYRKFKCNSCGRVGHLSRTCREEQSNRQNNFVEEEAFDGASGQTIGGDDSDEAEGLQLFSINKVECNTKVNNVVKSKNFVMCNVKNDIFVTGNSELFTTTMCVNGVDLTFEIDTGSAISAIPSSCYMKNFADCKLFEYKSALRAYDGAAISTKGFFNAEITRQGKSFVADFIVIDNGCRPLMGRDVLKKLNVEIKMINSVNVEGRLDETLGQFSELFDESLGKFKYGKISLKLITGAAPIFIKPRTVPFAYRTKLGQELDRLENLGVISRIEHSEWGTPLVTVLKKDGSLRVCADYSVTVNKFIDDVNYPLPRIDDLFQALQGGQRFSKLDLSQAFNQLAVDDDTSSILTW